MTSATITARRAAFLSMLRERLPNSDHDFDFGEWGIFDPWALDPDTGREPRSPEEFICGTHACAVGWAPFDPELSQLGWGVMLDGTRTPVEGVAAIFDTIRVEATRIGGSMGNIAWSPCFGTATHTRAAARFLEISMADAGDAFAGRYEDQWGCLVARVTPEMIADRLEKIFAEHPV